MLVSNCISISRIGSLYFMDADNTIECKLKMLFNWSFFFQFWVLHVYMYTFTIHQTVHEHAKCILLKGKYQMNLRTKLSNLFVAFFKVSIYIPCLHQNTIMPWVILVFILISLLLSFFASISVSPKSVYIILVGHFWSPYL